MLEGEDTKLGLSRDFGSSAIEWCGDCSVLLLEDWILGKLLVGGGFWRWRIGEVLLFVSDNPLIYEGKKIKVLVSILLEEVLFRHF